MELETVKKPLTIGMIILLTIAGSMYFLTDPDNTYYCEDRGIVAMCFKLSASNDLGISSRCYYNETIPTKYVYCKTGWKPIKDFPKIINNMTIQGEDISDIEPVFDETINLFEDKADAIINFDEYKDVREKSINETVIEFVTSNKICLVDYNNEEIQCRICYNFTILDRDMFDCAGFSDSLNDTVLNELITNNIKQILEGVYPKETFGYIKDGA